MSACALCLTQATFFAYLQKGTKSRNVGLPAARAFTGRPRVVVVVVVVVVVIVVKPLGSGEVRLVQSVSSSRAMAHTVRA